MADYPILDFNPFNIPNEYLSAIGLITSASVQAEHILQEALAGLLKVDVLKGFATSTHLSNPSRMDIIRSVAAIEIDDLNALDELDEILDALKSAMGKRNDYAHNHLCMNPDTKDVFFQKITSRGFLETKLVKISIAEIKKEAADIYNASMDLFSFISARNLLPEFIEGLQVDGTRKRSARKKRIK